MAPQCGESSVKVIGCALLRTGVSSVDGRPGGHCSRDGNNGTVVNESEQFLRRLQSAPRISAVFNPWWESDSETDIGPAAPKIRRRQLAAYFAVRLSRAKIALGAKRLCQHRPRLPAQAARCLAYHRSRIACQYLHRVTRSVRDGLRLSCDPGARRDRRLQPRDDARRASPERADVRPLDPNDAGATNSKPTSTTTSRLTSTRGGEPWGKDFLERSPPRRKSASFSQNIEYLIIFRARQASVSAPCRTRVLLCDYCILGNREQWNRE